MKKPKKKEKPESEKNFPSEEDGFDDLNEKACAGDIRSMMLLLAKHGNRGYELEELDEFIAKYG